jgi:hypothetical protein
MRRSVGRQFKFAELRATLWREDTNACPSSVIGVEGRHKTNDERPRPPRSDRWGRFALSSRRERERESVWQIIGGANKPGGGMIVHSYAILIA